jgi:transposase-like protein
MATTPPTVRVTIGQNTPSVKVAVGQNKQTVTNISYGVRTIKSSSDLDMSMAVDGDSIVYKANTNSFVVAPASELAIATIDGGIY